MDFFSTAAQALPVLYLAVIFQTFGRAATHRGQENSPFRSGLQFSHPERNSWKNPYLVSAVQLAAIGGETLALTETCEAAVAGALGFLGVLIGVPQTLWAFLTVAPHWAHRHPDSVLNMAFFAPLGGGLVSLTLVAWL